MTLAEFQSELGVISDKVISAHLTADAAYRRGIERLMEQSQGLATDEPEQFLAITRAEIQRIMTSEERTRR